MKRLSLLAIALGFSYGISAQCTLSGLNSFYCSEDSVSTLTASCNGTPTILGPGIVNGNEFDPSQAGTGEIEIYVLDGGPTYTIDTFQNFTDTIGPPSSATTVSLSDDAVANNLPIGFTFTFFANTYTTFNIASNGFIFFGSGSNNGCCSGQNIPSASAPNNLVAHAWEDLYPPGGGTISYYTVGTAPNRILVVDFDDVDHYCCTNYFPVFQQIHLHEGCGLIEIHTISQPFSSCCSTMGIENSNGTSAYAVTGRNSSGWTASNEMVSFTPTCGDTFYTYVSGGPDITFDIDTMDCFGDTDGEITAIASGTSPFTYDWSTGATTATITNLSNGTYTVTAADSAGCESVTEVEMESPDPLGAVLEVEDNDCEGGMAGEGTVIGTGGIPPYSYAWSNGASGATATGLATGNYSVSMTDANGCSTVLGIDVGFVNADPVVDLGDDKIICPGQSVVLLAPAGFNSYEWSDASTGTSIVVTSAGTYALTVSSSEGCEGSDTVEVVDVNPDQVDLGPDTSGLATIYVDAGSQYNSYLWNTGSTSSTLAITISGTYTVTVIDSNGCVTTDEVKVKIWPVGIQEMSVNGLMVYPNPATEFVTVRSDEYKDNVSIRVTDIMGREVINQSMNMNAGQEIKLNVSTLAPGNYTLIIGNDAFKEERVIQIQ